MYTENFKHNLNGKFEFSCMVSRVSEPKKNIAKKWKGRVAFVSLLREFRPLISKNFLRGNEEYWVQRSDPKTLWADEVEIGPLGRLAERRRQNLRQDCWRRIENSAEVFCTLSRSGTSGAASGVVEPPSTGSQRWVHKYFFFVIMCNPS